MLDPPRDAFAKYYTEKLWALVPAVYRLEDGLADNPGVLRSFVELIGEHAAYLRRSQDRLWDDQFIDLCAEWAVPYIGDLVATRLLSALNPRGRRIDVAKTIYYRRRKGTPRVLEELVSDITGWDGRMVEEFRRLDRSRHLLDPVTGPLCGPVTGTPPGGWADVRSVRGSELAGGPFDEFAYTPDVRRARGRAGRYNIPKLAFHLYPLLASPLIDIAGKAHKKKGRKFTFDPSGRDVPLFAKRLREIDYDAWHSWLAWELPAPIACRLLGDAQFVITQAVIDTLVAAPYNLAAPAADDLRTICNYRIGSISRLKELLAALPSAAAQAIPNGPLWPVLQRLALVDDCGKANLLWRDAGDTGSIVVKTGALATPIPSEEISAANLDNWPDLVSDSTALIDPERGRLFFPNAKPTAPVTASYHYGSAGPIGAGTYNRRSSPYLGDLTVSVSGGGAIPKAPLAASAVLQIDDSSSYDSAANLPVAIANLCIQANPGAKGQPGFRPYVVLGGDWTFSGGGGSATLTLEGLWIGAKAASSIVLDGSFSEVIIAHSTLDPGGFSEEDPNSPQLLPVPIVIASTAQIQTLRIDSSIIATISIAAGGLLENLVMADSIAQAPVARIPQPVASAMLWQLPRTSADIRRSTLFGAVHVEQLYASEALFTGRVVVLNTQAGCFRFSAAPTRSRLPHPYRSVYLTDTRSLFRSRRFGNPGFARLSDVAPDTIARGGEDTCEMGAFSSLHNQIKLDGLQTKVDEYMPFGLIPIYLYEE